MPLCAAIVRSNVKAKGAPSMGSNGVGRSGFTTNLKYCIKAAHVNLTILLGNILYVMEILN